MAEGREALSAASAKLELEAAERGLLGIGWLNWDLGWLFELRILRSISQGYQGIILPLYLALLGYNAVALGTLPGFFSDRRRADLHVDRGFVGSFRAQNSHRDHLAALRRRRGRLRLRPQLLLDRDLRRDRLDWARRCPRRWRMGSILSRGAGAGGRGVQRVQPHDGFWGLPFRRSHGGCDWLLAGGTPHPDPACDGAFRTRDLPGAVHSVGPSRGPDGPGDNSGTRAWIGMGFGVLRYRAVRAGGGGRAYARTVA